MSDPRRISVADWNELIRGICSGIRKARMTHRLMYDSTQPGDIPRDAPIVALYPHAWNADFSGFPHALQVRIDNRGDHADDCHVLDVERYAATPETAVQWIDSWHKLHPSGMDAVNGYFVRPTVYMSESPLAAFRTLAGNMQYDVWVANWSHGPVPVPGTIGVQYENPQLTGHSWDLSVITDDTWGVHPFPPKPVPAGITRGRFIPFDSHGTVRWDLSAELHTTDGGSTWSVPPGTAVTGAGFTAGAIIPYAGAGQVQWALSREVSSADRGHTYR
jgi:hypothetical protein